MNIGILGSGFVGTTLAAKLSANGHTVAIGTRDPAATLARTETGSMGEPPYAVWAKEHPAVKLLTFGDAAARGELLFNCTVGHGSIAALQSCAPSALAGKVLIDVSNPLDFSRGFPPSLFTSSDNSLAEQIQAAFPDVRVVKSLNTVNATLMVNPGMLPGETVMYVAGNDENARNTVAALLKEQFGWKMVVDLGDLRAARGLESLILHWINVMGALGTPKFNFALVK